MRRRSFRLLGTFFMTGAILSVVNCGSPPTAAVAPSDKAPARVESPAPAPGGATATPLASFVGDVAPVDHEAHVTSRVVAHGRIDSFHVIGLELDDTLRRVLVSEQARLGLDPFGSSALARLPIYVDAPGARVHFALLDRTPDGVVGTGATTDRIWLLVPEDRVGNLRVRVVVGLEWPALRFEIRLPDLGAPTTHFEKQYETALAEYARGREAGAFGDFVAARLSGIAPSGSPDFAGSIDDTFGESMRLSTGYTSIERALAHRRTDDVRAAMRAEVPLSQLRAPDTRRHEWDVMLKQLGRTAAVPPLSRSVPGDFYFVHARSGEALFRLLDEIERYGSPAAHLLEPATFRIDLSERYQTELGLLRGPMTRLLGPQAIEEVAVIGSDPFLRRGSDVSLLFRPKSALLLGTGLATSLAETAQAHGGLEEKTERFGTRTVRLSTSADGAIRRYQVELPELVLVSNSKGAVTRILETLDGKHRPLAEQPDFLYMLARDAERPYDVLAYAGDAFIESIVSPRSRVLDSRRGLAWTELRRVNHAALLHGLLRGRTDLSMAELVAAGRLTRAESRHFDGEAISRTSTGFASSKWGTPRRSTPLLDLPTPTSVSRAEQRAYESFANSYQAAWSDALDPIAFRLRFSKDRVQSHLRVLPLVRDRDYESIQELTGEQRLQGGEPGHGLRIAMALDDNSPLRRELEGMSQGFVGEQLSLGWVGDFAFIGVADEPGLLASTQKELGPQGPRATRREDSIGNDDGNWGAFPLYAGIQVKSRAQAALFLTIAGKYVLGMSRDASIEERPAHGGNSVFRVGVGGFAKSVSIYYALGRETLLLSFDEKLLHTLLDREAAGGGPHPTAGTTGPQMVFDLTVSDQGPLATFIAWIAQDEDRNRASLASFTELVSWGLGIEPGASDEAGRAELSRRFLELFGERPVTRNGLEFHASESGIVDPAWGNALHPRWPALPIAGSDLARLLDVFATVRSGMSFDAEAPGSQVQQQSLAVEFDVTLRR